MRYTQLVLGTALTLIVSLSLRAPAAGKLSSQQAAQQQTPPARFAFGGNAAEIPAEFSENLIFLPVDVNKSQPSLFILDSTAAASSMSHARAAELGLAKLQDPVLSLPGVNMPFANLGIVDEQNRSVQLGRPVQGTLGADFLNRVVVEIDYLRQTVRLYDPGSYKYSGRGIVLPLKFDGSAPVVAAKFTLPGQKTHEGEFVVDTALDAALLISEHFAEAHRVFASHMKTASKSDPEIEDGATIVLGRLKEFEIGHVDVQSPIAAFVRSNSQSGSDTNRAGVIGGGMLRRFTVIFDYAHQQMIFEPNTHFTEYEQEDKSGIAVVANGPGFKTF